MTISTGTLIAFAVSGLLAVIIPVGAIVIFKLRCREVWLPSALIGAGTFLVFALVLERLLHSVMLPVIGDNKIFYCVYGCLAAGVFEESGRFIAYKLFMKKRHDVRNAVMMGLGHGGFEAVAILGIGMLSNLIAAVGVNAAGIEAMAEQMAAGNAELVETARAQLEALAGVSAGTVALGLVERIIAMTFHVCMSVIVYKSTEKGRLVLFPAAILLHALIDSVAAMYQVGAVQSLITVYSSMVIILAAVAVPTIKIIKEDRKNAAP